MSRLLLIRHGRSAWNAERRIQGWADPPLDEVGRAQARHIAERLRAEQPLKLYTSPLQRAAETAEIIGRALGAPVVVDDRLKEHGVGDLEGLTWEEVVDQYPDLAQRWDQGDEEITIPGEEEFDSFRARVTATCDEIAAHHTEQAVGIVTHGGVLSAYLNHLIGLPGRFSPFRFPNCSLSVVQVNSTRPRILLLSDVCHLGGEI
ncbi:MAG TPA: histidine phosphatase family protein [Chloroflexi bacterium]|nr:histidine phosphatase family protein [Chloroflexota bacterium]